MWDRGLLILDLPALTPPPSLRATRKTTDHLAPRRLSLSSSKTTSGLHWDCRFCGSLSVMWPLRHKPLPAASIPNSPLPGGSPQTWGPRFTEPRSREA